MPIFINGNRIRHAVVSSKIMREFIPAGLVGDLHLTGFSFNDTGLSLKIQTAE